MLRKLVFHILCLTLISSASVNASANDMETVIERYKSIILDSGFPDGNSVTQLVRGLAEDGSWPDVDYTNQEMANWHTTQHLSRLKNMAAAYVAEGTTLKGNTELLDAINRAIDYWDRNRFRNPNWWFNEIGVPRIARDTAILMYGSLDKRRAKSLADIIAQTRVRGTGANLMWTAELALHLGCLTGDTDMAAENARIIAGEIIQGSGEGIRYDNSFHQHSSRLQAFHYGGSYLDVVCKTDWQLRGTAWEFPIGKRRIISDYILEGLQWMCRGTYTPPSTMDRMASRKNSMASADLRPLLALWSEVHPERAGEIDLFIARQNGGGQPLTGFRHFPDSDFTTYHSATFSFFVKTVSDRTLPAESINNENRKGRNMSSGDHYLLMDGDEYHNLQPVWDWDKLPGVTTAEGLSTVARLPFTGGLGNGESGFTVMTVEREGTDNYESRLSVRKMWVFHGKTILCLTGGWQADTISGPLETALEQCRKKGDVIVSSDDSDIPAAQKGALTIEKCEWVMHDGTGYMPLEPCTVKLHPLTSKGSWRDINLQYGDEPVSEDVFFPAIVHGTKPSSPGFAILPGINSNRLNELYAGRPWEIVRNDRSCQCVQFGKFLSMAAFFEAGSVTLQDGSTLSVDTPCLAMLDYGRLLLSDPTMTGGELTVEWNGKRRAVTLPPGGASITLE